MPNSASHRTVYCLSPLRTPAAKSKPKDDILSRLGRKLRELRLDRGFNQVEFAKHVGIDRSYLSDVERGRKSISVPMAEVIAIGLGIDLSELFKGL